MHETAQQVLEAFKKEPNRDFLTSELLKQVYAEEYEHLETLTNKKEHNRQKARLHRKLLYHLKSLESVGLLLVTGQGQRGEKRYRLALNSGEELIIKGAKKRVLIRKPMEPANPIKNYLSSRFMRRLNENNWLTKLDSILINAPHFSNLKALLSAITKLCDNVNDVIGINDFESLVNESSKGEIKEFVSGISQISQDYGLSLSLIFDFTSLKEYELLEYCILKLLKCDSSYINLIFDVKQKELNLHNEFFIKLIGLYTKFSFPLLLKNQDIWHAPYLLGKAGAYTFDEQEWDIYKTQQGLQSLGLCCCNSTILIDMERFHTSGNNASEFRKMMLKVAKSFLSFSAIQTKNANEYFSSILRLALPSSKDFFRFSKNYVRFWNFLDDKESVSENKSLSLIKSSTELVNHFCAHEETIYKSCGIPTRFKIDFSYLSSQVAKERFSLHKFNPFVLKHIKQLYEGELSEYIKLNEAVFRVFSGGNKLKLIRSGISGSQDIYREIQTLLNMYELPLISLNLGKATRPNQKLTDFM